jgi:hypothetical protein
MGFDIKGLKLLWNTVNEIASANGITQYYAMHKFYSASLAISNDVIIIVFCLNPNPNDTKKRNIEGR